MLKIKHIMSFLKKIVGFFEKNPMSIMMAFMIIIYGIYTYYNYPVEPNVGDSERGDVASDAKKKIASWGKKKWCAFERRKWRWARHPLYRRVC